MPTEGYPLGWHTPPVRSHYRANLKHLRGDLDRPKEEGYDSQTMSLGTKNRQKQTAEICKEHLRTTYPTQLVLVEDFIREIEGVGKAADVANWAQFTDLSHNTGEMLKRVDERSGKWLKGEE